MFMLTHAHAHIVYPKFKISYFHTVYKIELASIQTRKRYRTLVVSDIF